MIYDIATKELRQTLEGCGTLLFVPSTADPHKKAEEEVATGDVKGDPAYILVSNFSSGKPRPQSYTGLILWELDRNGRLLVEEEPIDPEVIATKAIEAILPDLELEHEWRRAFVDASNLRADFVKALEKTAAQHRRRNNTVIQNAQMSSFVQNAFSSDGGLMLYVANNRTTQHGMRDADHLPHVIVYNVATGRELHRLRGHTDMVAWFGFSPDDRYVASVSWDGTLRMYWAETAELEWATETSGGQSWSGAFSPDSGHIVWSSCNGRELKVHEVATGDVVSTFPETITHWCRNLSWHPTEQQIAMCVNQTAYVWRPFDGSGGTVVHRMVVDSDERFRRMAKIVGVTWMGNGRLLFVRISDSTTLIYDTLANAKEVFKRPRGVDAATVKSSFHELIGGGEGHLMYLSVDGDGKVRYWDRSVAPLPDVQPEQGDQVEPSPKESDAEQPRKESKGGGYATVMSKIREHITGTSKGDRSATASDEEREDWAQKGSSVWTAE